MGLAAVLNNDELTGPIAGEKGTGADLCARILRLLPLWLQIKDARGQARSAEREASRAGTDPWRAADWKPCVGLITQALKEKSKDLDLAAWLLEGMTCDHGFRGLADTFHVAADLIEKYWDGLYPAISDDGPSGRVQQFTGLNGDGRPGPLIDRIYNIPLTDSALLGPYDRDDYNQAVEMETVTDPERRDARIASGAVTLEKFNGAVKESSPGFFCGTFWMILMKRKARCAAFLNSQPAREKPGVRLNRPVPIISARKRWQTCRKVVETLGRVLPNVAAPAEACFRKAAAASGGGPAAATVKQPGWRPARSAAASGCVCQALAKLPRYFRDTEPQSPVSVCALEQVIRWGAMPLPGVADGADRG